MPSAALPAPPLDENARLGATLALSVLIHGIVLLGLGFALDDNAPVVPTLDVILSQTSTPLTPRQADFLAAASQQGGGDAEKSRRPRESQAGVVPQAEAGVSPVPLRAQSPDAAPPPQTRVVTTADSALTVPPQEAHPRPDRPDLPPGEQKIEHDMEMARLAAEIHLRSDLYAKRPKRKFVSASTQEYAWANYLRAWVDRAERVGNLNYPDEARRKRLSGQVVISVAVRRNGTVEQSRIIQSSGVPLLDSAALRVVTLAAPFPPLPDTDEHVDILHVTRTWVFLPAGELRDQ
ncbi:energy transducer TonB [Pseudoxanthomonas sp. X-1]|uniref:energy transducer TonB family protein n=1 Tax=Pseudoxanthomonas sp. X-1 TaxID=2571115 RepID=UPI00110C0D40|nr:energy transducer TonB [Pseudoxanthomonas sp. X-1]TMN20264.1 energy transducer TonB [Pseudoxanthomonas sp. X-1]UAY73546.1 energy transducer TonB [Pseudoxanthomonas sp. X-1]